MPFDTALGYGVDRGGPDPVRIETVAARFALGHPYLLFRAEAVAAIRRRAAADRRLRQFQRQLVTEPPAPPAASTPRATIKRRARRLIATAFAALSGVRPVADAALAESRRVLAELAAAPSWKERRVIRSFLDCAEIAVASALAYDWLYDKLTTRERQAVERAIRRNILEPALADYENQGLAWPRRLDNCTLVSNAGIAIAALAVVRSDRALSARALSHSLASTWPIFAQLAPDGAWREGPSYWSLAMRYSGLMTAALESAFGDSFGLADRPGFAQTGDFALHAMGPFGAAFNFGDSQQHYDASPLAWFGCRFERPVDSWLSRHAGSWSLLLRTIWPNRARAAPMSLGLPTGKIFYSGDLACFRNTWMSRPPARPVYLAIKGGNVAADVARRAPARDAFLLHSQCDAGTFVIDGANHRWAVDLGPDDYDLPGYFDHGGRGRSGRRWSYYRMRAAGHNTLLIGGRDQVPHAPAPILGGAIDRDCKWVVVDLSAAYGRPPGSVRRGAALLGRQVAIQDEIDPTIAERILWTMHVVAEEAWVLGSLARLRIGADRFEAHILEPAAARFELSAPPVPRRFAPDDVERLHGRVAGCGAVVSELPYPTPNADGGALHRLQIALAPGTPRITVLMLPDCNGSEPALAVTPLAEWLARRPVRLIEVAGRTAASRARSAAAATVAARRPRSPIRRTADG